MDILGLDGHIYKGRMDTRLPGIPSKDSSVITKHKAKPSRPHVHRQQSLVHNSQLPSRPQSAHMLAANASGTLPPDGMSFLVASALSPGLSPWPASPLSFPWLVCAFTSLERGRAWELGDGMGWDEESKAVITESWIYSRAVG